MAGGVEHTVDPTEVLLGGSDSGDHGCLVGHVGAEADRPVEVADALRSLVAVEIDDGDLVPFGNESPGGRRPDPRRAAGGEQHLALEVHQLLQSLMVDRAVCAVSARALGAASRAVGYFGAAARSVR